MSDIYRLEYAPETVEAIDEYYRDDILLQIQIINELYRYTNDIVFKEKYEKICEENHICPYCLQPLTKKVYYERRGDDPTYDEEITEYVCERCEKYD